jgi:hypothetical protein
MSDFDTSDLLTLEDVAFRLRISHWGLRRRMQERGIHCARKIGRRWYFDPSVFTSDLARPG